MIAWASLACVLLSFAVLVVGVVAARLWHLSTLVEIEPTWGNDPLREPTDPNQSTLGWVIGGWNANQKIAALNARAARCTAVAVVLGFLAGLAGVWPELATIARALYVREPVAPSADTVMTFI